MRNVVSLNDSARILVHEAKWPTESGAGVLAQVVLTMKIETCVSSAPAIGHAAAADL